MGTVHAFVLFGLYFVWVVFVLFCDAVKANHICFACALNRSQGLRSGPGVTEEELPS